ncbi:MAG TPA: PEGA domain-containing protein [Pyrinomonadaceae bacterium]|jgi:hypothetical protein
MKKGLAAVFALFLLVAAPRPADAQGSSSRGVPATQPRARSIPRRTVPARVRSLLERSADEIMEERPEVSDEILYDDMEVVQDAMPDIRRVFKRRGQSDGAAEAFTLTGWKRLRVERLAPAERMPVKLLIEYVVRLGTLVIKSTPAGARIEVDGKASGVTENVIYPSAGSYRVRLTMDGYEPAEEMCSVAEGQVTQVNKRLKPLPRRKIRP